MTTKQQPLIKEMEEVKEERYSPKTKNGYQLDEVRSSLQKSIRRGKELESIYWAYEMVESGFWRYLLRSLVIIAGEDIADPSILQLAVSLATYLFLVDSKKTIGYISQEWNPIGKLIIVMVRAKKNRIADYITSLVDQKRKQGWRLEIPDFCKDEHTKAGREKLEREGLDADEMFYGEGCKIANKEKVEKEQEYRDELMELIGCKKLVGVSDEELKS